MSRNKETSLDLEAALLQARGKRIPSQVVVVFTRQLSSMLAQAVPILRALDTLSVQEECPDFGQVVRICCRRVEQGGEFSQCVAQFPNAFPPIYKTMVKIGETTGSLDMSLGKLATWLERDQVVHQRVKSALTYPAFIITLSTVLTLAIFYGVMPSLLGIFSDMPIVLPWITRVMVAVTNLLRDPCAVLIGLGTLISVGTFLARYSQTRHGWIQVYSIAVRSPIFGPMLRFACLSRYCSSLEVLLGSGMDINTSLRLAASASGSPLLESMSKSLVSSVTDGETVAQGMSPNPELYPPTLRNMIAAGEEVSKVPEMCSRAAALYEMELNFRVEALSATLEPILLAGVAIVVATIVLSVFLPLYSFIATI